MNYTNIARNESVFSCVVVTEPVLIFDDYKVYQIVDSLAPNDLDVIVNEEHIGTFRHVAIDTDGEGHIYDIDNAKKYTVGICDIRNN